MRIGLFIVAAALAAGSAQAQTTSCNRTYTGMDCTTTPPVADGGQQFVTGMAALGANIRAAREKKRVVEIIKQDMAAGNCVEARSLVVQYGNASDLSLFDQRCVQAPDPKQAQRTAVASLVAQGQCEDAKTYALQYGDMDLAEQAMRICTPKPAGPPPP